MAASVHYRITNTQADVYVAAASAPSFEPHPTEYYPGELVGHAGDGRPIYMGFPRAVWTIPGPINADMMGDLLDKLNFGTYGRVFIRTRINETEAISPTPHVDDIQSQHTYAYFSGYMEIPEYSTSPFYQYRDVKVTFRHLVRLPDTP